MYQYYKYGTKEYYDQELSKAINNLRMAAKGFSALVKDDTPIGRIDEYVCVLRDAASGYETALSDYTECMAKEESNNGNA